MSGHVFHPGHDDLHGVTVVIELLDGRSVVGRWHDRTDRGVLLHNVAIYDPDTATVPKEEWFGKLLKFGVPVAEKHMLIPDDLFGGVRSLSE